MLDRYKHITRAVFWGTFLVGSLAAVFVTDSTTRRVIRDAASALLGTLALVVGIERFRLATLPDALVRPFGWRDLLGREKRLAPKSSTMLQIEGGIVTAAGIGLLSLVVQSVLGVGSNR